MKEIFLTIADFYLSMGPMATFLWLFAGIVSFIRIHRYHMVYQNGLSFFDGIIYFISSLAFGYVGYAITLFMYNTKIVDLIEYLDNKNKNDNSRNDLSRD